MKSMKLWRHVLVACAVGALAGCSGAEGPMGPEGPQGPTGQDGVPGKDGQDGTNGTSCTVTDNGGGKKTIACGDATVVVNDGAQGGAGAAGTSCTAKVVEGVKTVECTDGSKFTIADGAKGDTGDAGTSCSATVVDGVKKIACTDGTSFDVLDGAKGDTGDAGTSCSVEDTDTGATITCGDVTVLVADGAQGDTGETGAQGPVGPSAAQVFHLNAVTPKSLALSVTKVDTTGAKPVVTFRLIDDKTGLGAVGVKGGSNGWIRFGIAQFQAGVDGELDLWKSYVRSTSGAGTTEREGTLLDNGDGTYQYTFAVDVKAATTPVFDENQTQRLYVQLSGTPTGTGVALPYVNAIYTWVPAGTAVTNLHDVAQTASCNECHGQLRIHGSRIEVKYCSLCHNADLKDKNGAQISLGRMAHGIHAGHKADGSPMRTTDYVIAGSRSDYNFGEVTYPQHSNFCKKCHDGADAATPQGDNWAYKPTIETCGACHDSVDFAAPHMGRVRTNVECTNCHDDTQIRDAHAGENASPNVTKVIDGASNFTYEVKSVTMADDTHPVITFKITRDGVAIDPTVTPTDLTGGPSFLLAYALPQDGIDEPAEYNNRGRAAAQPMSVSLANLRAGTAGTLAAAADAGYYTATLSGTNAYPAGATLRAVGLQGYFTQTNVPGHANLGRHTVAAWAPVTDDPVRRTVVDPDKCANCHEWFEGHGGNRVRTVQVCVMCHVPNLSSSGRGVDPAVSRTRLTSTGSVDALEAAGYDADDPLTFPEQPQNLKDLLHATHGAHARGTPFTFVRDRGTSGVFYYDFSEITFPNEYNACLTCHKPGTFGSVPENALWSTNVTQGADASTTALVLAARGTVPNATDLVSSPFASTCAGCHTSPIAAAHMQQNGGMLNVERSKIGGVETCVLCHGAGREADVTVMHDAK